MTSYFTLIPPFISKYFLKVVQPMKSKCYALRHGLDWSTKKYIGCCFFLSLRNDTLQKQVRATELINHCKNRINTDYVYDIHFCSNKYKTLKSKHQFVEGLVVNDLKRVNAKFTVSMYFDKMVDMLILFIMYLSSGVNINLSFRFVSTSVRIILFGFHCTNTFPT